MDAIEYSNYIGYESLQTWEEMDTLPFWSSEIEDQEIIFPHSPVINNKLRIWDGEINNIRIQAIVISINSLMESRNSIDTKKLGLFGGKKYQESFVKQVIGCKTSEIRVIESYNIPANYVIHTVAPRYNPKFESAAINALYNCYRNSLMTAIEKGIRSVAFTPIHISRHPFPKETAIHLQARTIRRFLEKYIDYMDVIVIQVPIDLLRYYQQIYPIYFPRNENEEKFSIKNIPNDIGNENGQPTQPERSIRISAFPYGPTRRPSDDEEDDGDDDVGCGDDEGICGEEDGIAELSDNNTNENKMNDDITSSSKHSLSRSCVAPAVLRQSLNVRSINDLSIQRTLRNYEQSISGERKFDRLLRQSRKMEWSLWSDKQVFYQCGKDINDYPIFLVQERQIPSNLESVINDALSFIIGTLERDSKSKSFSIIYAASMSDRRPSKKFFTEVSHILTPRYNRQLIQLYLLHASFITRSFFWLLTTFTVPEIKNKIFHVQNLRQLYRLLNPSCLDLPDYIYEYDKQAGGSNARYISQSQMPSTYVEPIVTNATNRNFISVSKTSPNNTNFDL